MKPGFGTNCLTLSKSPEALPADAVWQGFQADGMLIPHLHKALPVSGQAKNKTVQTIS
jgi:hypothetical protein